MTFEDGFYQFDGSLVWLNITMTDAQIQDRLLSAFWMISMAQFTDTLTESVWKFVWRRLWR